MQDYKRYTPVGGLSKRLKAICDESLQDVEPSFYLPNRKALKTEEDVENLCKNINFQVVGDPVGSFHGSYKHLLLKCKSCGHLRNAALTDIRSGCVSCNMCLRIKLAQEAEKCGLKLLGDSTDGRTNRRYYEFSKCGHTRNIATGDVRVGSVSCTECREEKIKFLIKERGFILSDSDVDLHTGNKVNVKYVKCGHERSVLKSHLESGSIGECEVCYEKELQEKYGNPLGIDIIHKGNNATRYIKFRECGHFKFVSLSNLKAGSVSCQECLENKWKSEAEDVDLEWISKGEGKYSIYRAKCGHNIKAKPAHIRVGHWTCRECNSGWLTKPSYIYLFKIKVENFSFLKLGYSIKPEYRKTDYVMSESCVTELLDKVEIPTGQEAMRLENLLHKKYKEFNYKSSFIRQYLTESGFSECYPETLQELLLEELERIRFEQRRTI